MRHIASAASAAVLVCALTACSDRPSALEPVSVAQSRATAAANGPPTDASASFDIPNCGFTVHVELSGKSKTQGLPGQRTLGTAPGLTATVTNPANGKQETLSITGAFHKSLLENGDTLTVATGRNVLLEPTIPEFAGVFLTVGRFSWVVSEEGHLVEPLEGTGKKTDLCQLLA
jgi:hypothetical protein